MQTIDTQTTAKEKEFASVRVKTETRDRVLAVVDRLNKKELGRKVIPNDVIGIALTLLKPEHYEEIQDSTLSNFDRFDREYQAYVGQHGPITKDEYFGKILNGKINR